MTNFKKRTFTFRDAVPITLAAARVFPRLVRSFWKPRLSASLRERIMLAVISVNNCRYCSWVHTGLALTNDVDLDELDVLLGQNLEQKSDEREAVAILFAQHFADSQRRPSQSAQETLAARFNREERREIMTYIHSIYFANLSGNTTDAFLERLRGKPVSGSPLGLEILSIVVAGPILLSIWAASRRNRRTAFAEL